MSKSGKSIKVDVGLRFGGLILLALGAAAIKLLYGDVRAPPAHEASPLELLIGSVGFLSLSVGVMAATLGRHMFDPVPISARWLEAPPSDRR